MTAHQKADSILYPAGGLDNDWMRIGACTTALDLPWIADQRDTTTAEVDAMRTMCAGCPAQTACAEFVTSAHITAGFWAGQWRTPNTLANATRQDAA